MRKKSITLILIIVFLLTMAASSDRVQVPTYASGPDLYIADTTSDTGIEPNPDTGPMWISNDIWVTNDPDPTYQPYPYADSGYPSSPHTAHMNPEYCDPKLSKPNYIYVRVHNRGNAPSLGTEKLRIFWAKASTGLGWPAQWGGGPWTQEMDYSANVCGPTKLYGQEVTKPRKNAASVTGAERDAYRDAILGIGTDPLLMFPGSMSYWHKQQAVHQNTSYPKHHTPVFTPWHREYINRYEVLLKEQNPSVKLLYWDWTTDPSATLDTPTFMGASGAGGLANIGAPFNPSSGSTLAPPVVTRNLGGSLSQPTPITISDATILAKIPYGTTNFRLFMETNAHD